MEVTVVVKRPTSVDEVRAAFKQAATRAPLAGIMDVLEGEWTSARVVGDAHSSLVDLPLIQVMDDTLLTVAAWYDNEFGFASRLVQMVARLAKNP